MVAIGNEVPPKTPCALNPETPLDYKENILYIGVIQLHSDVERKKNNNDSHENVDTYNFNHLNKVESETKGNHFPWEHPEPYVLAESTYGKGVEATHFQNVLSNLRSVAESNTCSIFQLEVSGQWFVKIDENLTAIVVITKDSYPPYIGVECVDEVSEFLDTNQKLVRAGKLSRRKQKELDKLLMKYDDLENVSSIYKASKELDEVKQEMSKNIAIVLENVENAEKVQEISDDLLEQAKQFKKITRRHNSNYRRKKRKVAVASTGLALGATAGFLAGGPAGTAVVTGVGLATGQAIEAAFGASIGIATFMGGEAAVRRLSFWGNKFVFIPMSKSGTLA